jgi:hypothetical protein
MFVNLSWQQPCATTIAPAAVTAAAAPFADSTARLLTEHGFDPSGARNPATR